MIEELENGGYARLLYELLNTEITSDWSKVPDTEAKQEQIEEGLDPVKTWWNDSLANWQDDTPEKMYVHVGEKIPPPRRRSGLLAGQSSLPHTLGCQKVPVDLEETGENGHTQRAGKAGRKDHLCL